MKIVVTGTDTDIGKTVFAAGLADFIGARYWKPVQAGLPRDADTVKTLAAVDIVPETYLLDLPASPHQSAAAQGLTIDPAQLVPPGGDVVIEGAGGLMVPLSRQALFIDVFERWRLPLVLCASTRLGTINHTLLSLEAIRRRAIPLLGVAFVGDANLESEGIIAEKGAVRRLGRLPHLDPLNRASLRAAFGTNFRRGDFS